MIEAEINDSKFINPSVNILNEKCDKKSKMEKIENMEFDDLNDLSEEKYEKPKKKIVKKKKIKKELPKEITVEQIYNYIGKLGSKNKEIQELVYNQAVNQCNGDNNPKKIIQEIYKILKK
jgi:glutamyl-tRNA reductase